MMKTEVERNMMDLVFKAKLLLESRHLEEKGVEWYYAACVDAQSAEENRVEVYVLRVEQPLGYIIASFSIKTVKVLDEYLSSLITYTINEESLV